MLAFVIVTGAFVAVMTPFVVYMYWHWKNYHYKCLKCENLFVPATYIRHWLSFNDIDKRKIKCPTCNKNEWALTIKGRL